MEQSLYMYWGNTNSREAFFGLAHSQERCVCVWGGGGEGGKTCHMMQLE